MIQMQALTKIYRTEEVETTALDSIELTIGEGEFVALMGPSGCGKSTLLNIIGLLDSPTSGQYRLLGREVSATSEKERARLRKGRIGFVFQNFNLIEELTVRENVEVPLLYLKVAAAERRQRADELLERMDIGHRRNHYPPQLSGGQQQRVAIARALIVEPSLVVADEPTGNLDSKNGAEVLDLLAKLHSGGTTIVMATHSSASAERAQTVLQMEDGHLVDGAGTGADV